MSNKINGISIVFPCDKSRIPLLLRTISKYMEYGIPDKVELILVSRTYKSLLIPGVDIKVIHYEHEGENFCPSKAFNLGVEAAQYDNIIIGHPEVKPYNNVLSRFMKLERGNYCCRVYDLDEYGNRGICLFGTGHRDDWPGLYFLAMYRKEDIEAINGWDMRFMDGYANEDIDFGQRMENAGFHAAIRDDIIGEHQWHSRSMYDDGGEDWKRNRALYEENKTGKIWYCLNGLKEV